MWDSDVSFLLAFSVYLMNTMLCEVQYVIVLLEGPNLN